MGQGLAHMPGSRLLNALASGGAFWVVTEQIPIRSTIVDDRLAAIYRIVLTKCGIAILFSWAMNHESGHVLLIVPLL